MADIDLNDVAVFVRVVELGAFAKVARELRVPTSTVSRTIARLEDKLGVALLRRTTRSLTPTSEGRAFHADVAPAVAALKNAARGVEGSDKTPRGKLRITAPNDLAAIFLADVVVAFAARYPRVEIDLVLTARRVSLVEEGVDVALRAGPLADSRLVARKVGELEAAFYAAPSYVAARGAPRSLEDLERHDLVLFRAKDGESASVLRGPSGEVTATLRGRVSADDFLTVRALVVAGGGVALLPRILAAPDLASARLVPVLPELTTPGAPLHLVHAATRGVPAKIVAFRDFVLESYAKLKLESGDGAGRAKR